MAKKFGLTWWGEQWLNSLKAIDYENRIPRGATYARNGLVKSVKMEDNIIVAKVQGSRITPYTVKIMIPKFTESEQQILVSEIITHPAIISKLLNRELSPEIFNIAKKKRINLFPQTWRDLGMKCSCPDWAVPCKHLAAVIYTICAEIDNNPFIIFQMRGMDIFGQLQQKGINTSMKQITAPLQLATLIQPNKKAKKNNEGYPQFKKADFSKLQNLLEPLTNLLPQSPVFYSTGNFQTKYSDELRRCMRQAQRILNHKITLDNNNGKQLEITRRDAFTLTMDENGDVVFSCNDNEKKGPLSTLLNALSLIPSNLISDYHQSTIVLHQLAHAAIELMAHAAIVPQIVEFGKKSHIVRWLPANIDHNVQELTQLLEQNTPPTLFAIQNKEKPQYPTNQSEWIVSSFINSLIDQLSTVHNDKISELFFRNRKCAFNDSGEKEIPGGIRQWTMRLFMQQSRFFPVFMVDETNDEKFTLNVLIGNNDNPDAETIPLFEIMQSAEHELNRFEILRMLTNVSDLVNNFEDFINQQGEKPIKMTNHEVVDFILRIAPMMQLLRAKVILPKSLQNLVRPLPSVTLRTSDSSDKKGFVRIDDLLSFDWQVALGNHLISIDEFNKLTNKAQQLIKFKGSYFIVTPDDIHSLQKTFTGKNRLSSGQLLQIALSEQINGAPIKLTDEVKKMIKQLTSQENIDIPSTLQATLRPYQQRGYSWMYRNMQIGFGSILADDMGLGKTIQTITLLLKLKEEGALDKKKALIVAPKGLLTNWQYELNRFAPTLSATLYHGSTRKLDSNNNDITLTSYGTVRSDIEKIKKEKWQLVIIDEAQNIKNDKTAQSEAVRSIPAGTHIALSGTPVENRLTEYWTIMDFANKGYLGTVKSFNEEYANAIHETGDQKVVERFRKITAPFMMRRLKTDKKIINDLPDKIEINEYSYLTPQQIAIYKEITETALKEIEQIETTDNQSLFVRQGLILQMIMALKQICNHPSQFLKDKKWDVASSGKAEMLLDLLQSITSNRQKVLIFTQYKEMGEILQHIITEELKEKPLFYHGGCSLKERQAMVEAFQSNNVDNIFILSLKAAGTGLNLTAASHVIHYDLWWNPAVEAQATDRAYRIGQKNNVLVHRFITKDTFEEKIDLMIQQKKALAELTVEAGENWIGKLTNKELHEIFK